MSFLFTLAAFAFAFWYFGFRTGRPQLRYWPLYALVAGAALRWGLPLLWALAKPIAGILIAVIAIVVALSVLRRHTSAPS